MKLIPEPSNKYFYLLCALFALICIFPFVRSHEVGVTVLEVVFIVIVISIVLVGVRTKKNKLLAYGAGFPLIAVRLVTFICGNLPTGIEILFALLTLLFFAGTIVFLLMDIFTPGPVTADKISGTICVYLLIGLWWALLYCLVEMITPGSFRLPSPGDGPPAAKQEVAAPVPAREPVHGKFFLSEDSSYLNYFSFVTLTSTGYGDVLPLTPPARTFAWLEAVIGQFYIAVLVARLVGLHIVHSQVGEPSLGTRASESEE